MRGKANVKVGILLSQFCIRIPSVSMGVGQQDSH